MGEMIELEDLLIHTDFIQSKKNKKQRTLSFLSLLKNISLRFINLSYCNISTYFGHIVIAFATAGTLRNVPGQKRSVQHGVFTPNLTKNGHFQMDNCQCYLYEEKEKTPLRILSLA